MRPKLRSWRWAMGFALALASALPATTATTTANAATTATASQQVGAPQASIRLVKSHVQIGDWQAKKKRKSKVTNPDTLPQPLVAIIPGSSINLLSRSSKLPIAIKNDYDVEVRVRVRVQASTLKVLFPAPVEVVVPAHTTVTAKVPVNAIANGDVVLQATLESFSGVRLTMPVEIKMNVILGVEDTVLYGFLSFIAVLGALGAFRTVRKRRRERAAQ